MDQYGLNYKDRDSISSGLLIFNALLVLFIVLMFFAIYAEVHKPKQIPDLAKASVATSTPFDNLNLDAKAIYVYDLAENKILYQKNEVAQLPLASLTKLMMAVTAEELLPKDSKITIKKEFLAEDGDTGLLANESWKLNDLLDFSLVVSSNDGARSIASVAGAFDLGTNDYDLGLKDFVNKMNIKAQQIGLKQTYFVNADGLDIGDVSGGYGSAIDVAKLMQYMLVKEPDLLDATKYQTISVNSESKNHTGKNTDIVVDKIPGLLASKTGFTDSAGGNLAVAFDTSIGHPIIVVVLGSTIAGRFSDVSKLVDASFAYSQKI